MSDSVKRSSKELVSPAADTDAAESKGHHDAGASGSSRSSETLAGPYKTNQKEASGHDNGKN